MNTFQPSVRPHDLLPFGLSMSDAVTLGSVAILILVMVTLATNLSPRGHMKRRVKQLSERQDELKTRMLSPKRRRGSTVHSQIHWIRHIVERFKLLKSAQVAQHQKLLIEAGWRSKDAMVIYAFASLISPIIGLLLGLVIMGTVEFPQKAMLFKWGAPLFTLYVGLKLPMLVALRKRKRRYHAIRRALSDTLDLMTICAEAGLSLGAALGRVSKELTLAYPEMATELSFTALEMGFLPERNKAMYNLATRANIEEIRGIVNVLVQTEKYGTPIAQALRVLAAEFREQRMLRAENKAARLPAMMTVPMILFILPTLFIIIMTPAVLKAKDSWK